MMTKPKPSWSHSSRAGLTLVEVIAATLLLGTLLVSILMAFSQHAAQIKKAQQRLTVIDALDSKIAEWYLTRRGVPANESGMLLQNDTTEVRWRTAALPDNELKRTLLSRKVRVEATSRSGEVLASVDVLQEASR